MKHLPMIGRFDNYNKQSTHYREIGEQENCSMKNVIGIGGCKCRARKIRL